MTPPASAPEPAAWLIWSGEHRAWWRPDARGYCNVAGGAGRYTRQGAQAWLDHAGPEKQLEIVPDPYGTSAKIGVADAHR
jgi:hypothetical protein